MKDKVDLAKTIDFLNEKYNNALKKEETLLYAKMAFLEFCGWIEECMDSIALECSSKLLQESGRKHMTEHIEKNHSFTYLANFRPLIASIVGLCNLEKIEAEIDLEYLSSMTGCLKTKRDELAHQSLNVQKSIDAPSKVKSDLTRMFDELDKFEKQLKKQMSY